MNVLPYLPIIAAGLVPFLVGSIWYHPKIFGEMWMRMKRITPDMAERSSRLALHTTAVMIALGILSAFMLSRVLYALAIDTYVVSVVVAFCVWIGFVIPVTINRVLWDHESLALYGIETGQWLVSLCIMAIVLID
jgi:membrane protein YdbS with pleckstrin-like domain